MPALLSNKFRNLVAESFYRLSRTPKPIVRWESGISVSVGDLCYYLEKKYIASSSGTTGASPPLHSNGSASDGTVNWIYLESMLPGEFNSGGAYFFIAKSTAWPDDNNPPTPVMTDEEFDEAKKNIIALSKYASSRIGIRTKTWVTGTIFAQYDSETNMFADLVNNPFYCIVDEARIYVCLNNNNGAESVNKPIGTDLTPVLYADGYQWKYVGEISGETAFDYIEVAYKKYDDGSAQWDVQEGAKFKSISTFQIAGQTGTFTTPTVTIESESGSGAVATATKTGSNTINQILVTSEGQDYEKDDTFAVVKVVGAAGSGAEVTLSITGGVVDGYTIVSGGSGYTDARIIIVGDGTGASATATIFSNAIDEVTITNGGTGYTWAEAFVIPGTAGAVGVPVMAPITGHGANILTELGSYYFWNYLEIPHNDYFTDDVEFRQIGIITNVKDTDGEIASENHYIGPAHPEYDGVAVLNRMDKQSGDIIYLNNMSPVSRSAEQDERIRVNFTF
jgi:hypothetical protein